MFPAVVHAAILWNRFGPRGKAAVPRTIGRMWRGSEVHIRTRNGALLAIDFRNLDVYAHIHNASGNWEPHVMSVCERLLGPSDVFYDIGSNTGLFAIDFAKRYPGLTAYAFEPQPSLAAHIRRSIELNQMTTVTCIETMLGAQDGNASLYLTSHAIHASIAPREDSFQELKLPIRRLDGLVEAGTCEPPTLIKIDVEGSELAVLRGAHDLLREHTPCVVFEADVNLARVGLSTQQLIDSLCEAADYTFFVIGQRGELLAAEAPYPLGNYLALPPRYADRIEI